MMAHPVSSHCYNTQQHQLLVFLCDNEKHGGRHLVKRVNVKTYIVLEAHAVSLLIELISFLSQIQDGYISGQPYVQLIPKQIPSCPVCLTYPETKSILPQMDFY